jgi:hypothetical protein
VVLGKKTLPSVVQTGASISEMSYTTDDYDLEKQASSERQTASAGSSNDPQHGVHNTTVVDTSHARASGATGSSVMARLLHAAGKLGVEQRGIERVPEDERTETGFKAMLNISTMWFSANMVVAAFALGLLAQSVFNLGVADAMLVILFFNLIGITPVCFFSTFGPRFGLWVSPLSSLFLPLCTPSMHPILTFFPRSDDRWCSRASGMDGTA